MEFDDLTKEIQRLSNEIAALNTRIRNHVYRSAWNVTTLRGLRSQLESRKQRRAELQLLVADAAKNMRAQARHDHGNEAGMTTTDSRRVANALYTQRPLGADRPEWEAYERICASLVRLLGNELVSDGEFDAKEFLVHCGLSETRAHEIATRPGDYIRRSEDLPRE